ncbi:uncharacterized protein PHACADRAFT_198316 [Phanerochaete carnosa HHB-10118-sp]|uniref:Protein kinase domain-containing protein n=1 Tax=Phanerochaete carnosa (strain HHB-10118-sp) TaxID=650164 RepID=K5UQY9_PHACS|nr:uncharacterized protein PHACADRAFT_198316 [Phanerochaete carnosa HHB-10118-sp]EKM52256.1 hypothetical protein PHACADRAFT_198316 [Phanerochaete carnosa HHB-10118-sp]
MFSIQNGMQVTLEYTSHLSPDEPLKALFKALANISSSLTEVVVKFALTYLHEGHELLANSNLLLAPKLWYCEKVDSINIYVIDPSWCVDASPHHKCLCDAVNVLHEANFVFEDLCEPNVLLCDNGAMLIDFDWCGKEREACYPSDILMDSDMPWHASVQREGLITKEHDCHLLDKLAGPPEQQGTLLGNVA